ncbi:hypothetical protein CPB83DRAFT_846876 [Crepidotus variabilis]|uniref:CNH domain-containing protein n=1 Tax=Crepidotus variabilis TaxID=179855 RepID=A0A9P6JUI2_9AGAR|nr:hypothetical protein CPB83DRAFT_846876 [Crepidotus variabilis]
MAPFNTPKVVLSGLKEKFESLTVHLDRLYLGSSTGNLHIYDITDGAAELSPVEIKKSFVRRSIDQLGFIQAVNSLVVLSEMNITLFPLPSYSPPTPLPRAKAAFSFAVQSYLTSAEVPSSPSSFDVPKRAQPIPSLVTLLLIGCRRKVVIYSWKDGDPQDVKETLLPHSARSIVFLNNDTACFAYSTTEFALFSLATMTATDIVTPLPTTSSGAAMNALSGLTGYMTLGLGAKAKPTVINVAESEVLIGKDGQGYFINPDGKTSRSTTIEWPAQPEEIAFVKPYIFAVLPAGTVASQGSNTENMNNPPVSNQTALIQVRSSISLQVIQHLQFPFDVALSSNATGTAGLTPAPSNAQLRLMTSSFAAKSPLFLMTTPLDKTAAASEGSSLWRFNMKPWIDQIDELVMDGKYSDALTLLETLDECQITDKDQRKTKIRALNAVSQFRAGKFDEAIDTFIKLDFNPAKVVALYPESVAGRLAVPQERWISLYGGPVRDIEGDAAPTESDPGDAESSVKDKDKNSTAGTDTPPDKLTAAFFDTIAGGTGTMSGRLRKTGMAGLQALLPGGGKDDDTSSISSKKRVVLHDDLHRSVETLLRYLGDRRPKFGAALRNVGITPESQSHVTSPLSEASVDDVFALPDGPLSSLTPAQLLRFAQIVDTALYKAYLINRPVLLGSLCRVANWCEVSEVEDDLRARKKYGELRDLYHGKKMHSKALDLLKELAEQEADVDDKLSPSIQYLQKLGPEYIDQVFRYATWIFECDSNMAFQIFTSEDVELPRKSVADYLQGIDPKVCAKFLEFIIHEKQEELPEYHDRLAELYLNMTLSAKKHDDSNGQQEAYTKLLSFISTDDKIDIDRLYALSSRTDLHEARAILLGRRGRHDQAIDTYVNQLHDYTKAEEYCKRVYKADSDTSGVFLTLLRIYLRPTEPGSTNLLQPALDLISRHSPRLDSVEVLELLPPLVTMDSIRPFLADALCTPVFDTQVVRNISKARNDHMSRKLMALQMKRVKVTDSRICPQCHKRLGNSVIAVHVPRGEVTHYNCREPFSRRLKELRR